MLQWYYVDRQIKSVIVLDHEEPLTLLEFLGSSNNPNPKSAVAAFLPNESGYRIIMQADLFDHAFDEAIELELDQINEPNA